MAYLSYARGFKAGGFNGTDTTGVSANLPFSPEHVHAYELGLKSEWRDSRILFNAALFRSDYSDLQVSVNQLPAGSGPAALLVKNAATSRTQGLELEGQWVVGAGLHLAANATYLDSHYVRYPNAGATIVQLFNGIQLQDLSGRPTEFAPKWSGSVSVRYRMTLPGEYAVTTEAIPYFSSSYYLHDSDDPFFEQHEYVRLDARVALESTTGRWGLDLVGKNLTNQVILAALGSFYTASKQEPRNLAAQVWVHW
jgi:outer membrane receptor protein involved in Fe transport